MSLRPLLLPLEGVGGCLCCGGGGVGRVYGIMALFPSAMVLSDPGVDLRAWPKSGRLCITNACARGRGLGVFVAEPPVEAQ